MMELNITNIKKQETGKPKRKSAPKTLLQHIERIIDLAESSKLSDEFYEKAKNNIRFVAKKMELTANQTVLFSLFLEKSGDYILKINALSQFLGCRNIQVICMMKDIDELEKRRLIRCHRDGKQISYRVPIDVINAVKQNIVYTPKEITNLTTEELFRQMNSLFEERENKELSESLLLIELKSLINANSSLIFCRQMKEYESKNLYAEYLLLLFFCHRFINLDDDCIGFHDFEDLYDEKWRFQYMKSVLEEGECDLMENNILEYDNDYGLGDRRYFKITSAAKELLFSELSLKIKQPKSKKDLILHDKIVYKALFYNDQEKSQINQLSSLLKPEDFVLVQKKLENNGMRKGFACLFHGAPGTGKTETVYQLARATGRDIMPVDISETKSMWFGESEKIIKKVFDKYRAFVKTHDIAPILLFNEADAVIGKRKEATNSAIDQTENSIQNIILQEMENLDGIMIATTNLIQNLDKAFERRFLYKIEFKKPNVEAKKRIWLSIMPELSDQEAFTLANAYDFSGGQIENIARKRTINSIINNEKVSFEHIQNFCREELLGNPNEFRRIGF